MRRRLAVAGLAGLAGLAGVVLSGGALSAQEIMSGGVPVVVLPVQSAVPGGGGTWVGGTGSLHGTIDLLNAEIEFALGEERGVEQWVLAPAVEARLARNPTIGIDPRQLAHQGLLTAPEPEAQIHEPLHTQLRQVAALFGARLVVLPLSVSYEEDRAVLRLAVIDVRRSAVLWHGAIAGAAAEAASPFALTTLALRVADRLAPS